MNQTKIFATFNQILHDAVNRKLSRKFSKAMDIIEKHITDPILLDKIRSLFDEQRYEVRTVLKLNVVRKTRTKREIDPDIRCMARIGLGTQCSRSRIDRSDYCKSHQVSLPYGRADSPESLEKKIAKRRGRRSKNDKDYNIKDLDMDKYVQAILIKVEHKNGCKSYLLDQNDVLYQFNSNNEIAGYLVNNDHIEWYN